MSKNDSVRDQTIRDFGDQWLSYTNNTGYYNSQALLADILGPEFNITSLRGSKIIDIGSGTGRIVNMLMSTGADKVIAIEPSESFIILKRNTEQFGDTVSCLNIRGDEIPKGLNADFVISIGVIHHIPDPNPVIKAAFNALRSGGQIILWVYGREGNELYLIFTGVLRKLTTKIPHFLLVSLSWIIVEFAGIYSQMCRLFPLPMNNYFRNVYSKLSWSVKVLIVYDQLNPAYAKYYFKEEAVSLLSGSGFKKIVCSHRHGYSWTIIGYKPDCELS